MKQIQSVFIICFSLAVLFCCFTRVKQLRGSKQRDLLNQFKCGAISWAKWVDTSIQSLTPKLPGVLAHDKEVISFFDSICPEGWEPYERARNRFIMGSNTDDEIGMEGGSNKVTLTAQNLPTHNHAGFSVTGPVVGLDPGNYPIFNAAGLGASNYQIQGSNGQATHGKTSATGGSEEFDITPPYLKLKLCKKLNENVLLEELNEVKTNLFNHIADFNAFKPSVQQLQTDLDELKSNYQKLDDEFEDYRGYALTFHVIAIVALIFLIFDMVMWLISISRIRRLEKEAQSLKYPDTPRQPGDRYR